MTDFRKVINQTVRDSMLPAEVMAKKLNMKTFTFYKAADFRAGNKKPFFKLGQLVELMKMNDDYRILAAMCERLGFVTHKIPALEKSKPEDFVSLQKTFCEFSMMLWQFMEGKISQAEMIECANRCLTKVAEAREMVKASDKQPSLFDCD
jgi:hypothetical protein